MENEKIKSGYDILLGGYKPKEVKGKLVIPTGGSGAIRIGTNR